MFTYRSSAAAVLLGLGLLARADGPPQKAPIADKDLANWLDGRIGQWQPTALERRFDRIGWAGSLTEAERLARQTGRPLFLFTYNGASIASYRC